MSGKTKTTHITIEMTVLNGLILGVLAAMSVIIVGMLCMHLIEARLKKSDQHNQERISWTCNGNGIADCVPYRNA